MVANVVNLQPVAIFNGGNSGRIVKRGFDFGFGFAYVLQSFTVEYACNKYRLYIELSGLSHS